MKLVYDREADALYIRLLEGQFQCRAVRVTDDIALDFAQGEKLVGIEVLHASRIFDEPGEPSVELQDLLAKVVPS